MRPFPWRGADRRRVAFHLAAAALALMALMPVLVLALAWREAQPEVWRHLADTVLWQLLGNTLFLLAGVAVGVLVLGVGMAWAVTAWQFPGRAFFDRALMLPFAMPAYVLAFVMVDLFDYAGPVQTTLRALWPGFHGFSARQPWLVVACLTLVFYPYVFLLARNAFRQRSMVLMEQARVLGLSPWRRFVRVVLPLARPALAGGLVLALMETLADFGAVSVFNYDTFTTAIYKSWYGLFNLQAAAQLASTLLLLVLALLAAERWGRGRARYSADGGRPPPRRVLPGVRGWLVTALLGAVLTLAFVAPVLRLLQWVWQDGAAAFDARFRLLLGNTLVLGAAAAALTVAGAWLLAHGRQYHPGRLMFASTRAATLGYAMPGSVLAVGIMFSFVAIDRGLAGLGIGAALTGTVAGLLLAYAVRFMAVAFAPVEAAYARIGPALTEVTRTFGVGRLYVLRRLYLPLLAPGLSAAALLVAIDVMKEMPATLLLRPFGGDTLAVRIYAMTAEGMWEKAALPALTLVLVGLLPVLLLIRERRGPGDGVSRPPV